MRVVVNQLAALGVKTGIGHYTVELIRCLKEQAGNETIQTFPQGWIRLLRESATQLRPRLEGAGSGKVGTRPGRLTRLRKALLRQVRQAGRALINTHFRAVCAREKYDLYHETNFIPLTCCCPTVATLHDLSVVRFPQWHPSDRVAFFERHFERSRARCQHFFAISEFGRQELIRVLGIPGDRVTVSYMGIRPGLGPMPAHSVREVLHSLKLPPRYLLYLGTIEPRKNVLTLLRAYCALPASVRERWPLVLVGNWGWNAGEVARYLQEEAVHRGAIHLGYLPEEHLPALYNGARALVFPSHYEGFGLPPIEMMACGGAVLASTAGAIVETVGNKAHLIAAEDEEGWHRALQRIVEDDDWWASLRRGAMAVARPYTWDRCAAETLRVYRQLSGESAAPDEQPRVSTPRAA